MDPEITPKLMSDLRRAFFDPMIGGWPLIHWEWVFALARQSRGLAIVGSWPESDGRAVTLRMSPADRDLTEEIEVGDEEIVTRK